MKDLEFNNDNDKISSAAINDSDVIDDKNNFVADDKIIEVKENVEKDANDTPVVNEKIVEEKLNTISVAVNDSDVIDDKNNFVADEKIIEVKENVKKDEKNIPVVNDKIVEEKLNTISAAVNESVVIGEKNDFVADEKIIEVKENVEKDANDNVKEIVVRDKIVEEVIFEEKGNESVVIGEKNYLVKKLLKRMHIISWRKLKK